MQFNYYTTKEPTLQLTNQTVVPVIASYDSTGICTPLYFRYTNEKDESTSIKIDKILSSKPNSIFGMIYECQVTVVDQVKIIRLFHHEQEHRWYLRN